MTSHNNSSLPGQNFGKAFDIADGVLDVAGAGASVVGSVLDIIYAQRERRAADALREFGRDLQLENLGQTVASRSNAALARDFAQGFRDSFVSTQIRVRGGIDRQRLLDNFALENQVQKIQNEKANINRIVNVVSRSIDFVTDVTKTVATVGLA